MVSLASLSALDERSVFVFGLGLLFLSGLGVLCINAFTDSRKAQLADSLSESLWGFTPHTKVQVRLRRQRWAYRKLVASGEYPPPSFLAADFI
jgi:hypothetical protein